ncbi:MAG: hypothetical protein J6U77_00725, partial [Verrucomicrobia bacterium]|nr:hypothetical protein [Verrucomicrobiota bacterium]
RSLTKKKRPGSFRGFRSFSLTDLDGDKRIKKEAFTRTPPDFNLLQNNYVNLPIDRCVHRMEKKSLKVK